MSAPSPSQAQPGRSREAAPRWLVFPGIPLGLTLLLLGFLAFPRVGSEPGLVLAILGAAAVLLGWVALLWAKAQVSPRTFGVDVVLVRAHYIQAVLQASLYAYWGWYWREVYRELPLIAAQLVFLCAFDALLSWSRGRRWRFGLGALPIILSTNVFIWFRDDWFSLQFLMVATAALGKEFIKWERGGRMTHIFNPSAFALVLFSTGLILTGTTNITWAAPIADSFAKPPHIYLFIFSLGVIVQYFFSVTLVTFSAAAALCLLGFLYTRATGTYYFVFWNIPAPVFLGLHLLVTDPATSPRTYSGRVVFGVLYGISAFALYGLLSLFDVSTVYDKLLPIPILNLFVERIDRRAQSGIAAVVERWHAALKPRQANLIHMGGWSVLFLSLLGTGYVDAPHEGSTYLFWRKAVEEGRFHATRGLLEVVKSLARDGHSEAWNELGMMYMEGKLVPRDPKLAVQYFAQASKLGNVSGAGNLATQFLQAPGAEAGKSVLRALDQVEAECAKPDADGTYHFLIGYAYELGKGRPADKARAFAFYREGCARGSSYACEGLKRLSPGSR